MPKYPLQRIQFDKYPDRPGIVAVFGRSVPGLDYRRYNAYPITRASADRLDKVLNYGDGNDRIHLTSIFTHSDRIFISYTID